jgi:hypothetical protein
MTELLQELRTLNPGHWVIPTDEEYAESKSAKEQAEAAEAQVRADAEAAEAAKAQRIAELEHELAELKGEAQG